MVDIASFANLTFLCPKTIKPVYIQTQIQTQMQLAAQQLVKSSESLQTGEFK